MLPVCSNIETYQCVAQRSRPGCVMLRWLVVCFVGVINKSCYGWRYLNNGAFGSLATK